MTTTVIEVYIIVSHHTQRYHYASRECYGVLLQYYIILYYYCIHTSIGDTACLVYSNMTCDSFACGSQARNTRHTAYLKRKIAARVSHSVHHFLLLLLLLILIAAWRSWLDNVRHVELRVRAFYSSCLSCFSLDGRRSLFTCGLSICECAGESL